MILLEVREVVKRFGPEPVLAGVSLEVRPGDKLGLVGPNGAGKSTLLKIIAGQEDADAGEIARHSSCRLGYLEQHASFEPGRTVWDEAAAGLASLTQLTHAAEETARALAEADDDRERQRLAARFDRLQAELAHHDAYSLDHRIERVLDGLGFARAAHRQPVDELSGGQQNRLLLARLLLEDPELLVLDEPSNHLDIDSTQWLENYLADSAQALVVVSHDRYFLDRVTNGTLELVQGTVDTYAGNFSAYWRQKADRLKVAQRTYDRQREQIAKTEDFIRRNRYGQKSAQAQDRVKKLERIERVAPPREIVGPAMGFPEVERSGDIVLRVEHLSKGFDRPLFSDLSFDVLRGQRWGILGPNGSGKTTLLKCLVRLLKPDQGEVIQGTGVRIGYFDQHLADLDPDSLVVDAVRPSHKEFHEPIRRSLLARFGIVGDQVFQRVGSLSGGERNRVALARLAAADANLLVLDEPTNHLDLWARDSLERAILAFDGTVVFVSHDRYFINRVADHVLAVEPPRFRVIDGNYETYLHLSRATADTTSTGANSPQRAAATAVKGQATAKGAPAKRKRRFPYRKVSDLEQEIFMRESRVEQLQNQLVDPEVLRSGARVRELQAELSAEQTQLAQLYEHWEEATELN